MDVSITVPIYPKVPGCTYKDVFDKILPLYKRLLDRYDAKDMIIMGDSAGGGMSLALGQLLLENNLPQPGNIVLLSPWLDINLKNKGIEPLLKNEPLLDRELRFAVGKIYADNLDSSNYLVSPINGIIKGLGKLTLFIGTHEIFLPDARKFRTIALENDVDINYFEYPKMNHVFNVFSIPEAKKTLKQIISIISN